MNSKAMIRRTLAAAFFVALALPLTAGAATAAGDVNCVDLPANLAVGSSGAAVSALQAFLRDAGFFDGEPTAYFGNMTAQAVIAFQGSKDISPANGVAGETTRAAIRRQSCSRVSADASAAASGAVSVTAGGVKFDLTPVPNRKGGSQSSYGSSGSSSKTTGKFKIVLNAKAEKTADGEADLSVSVGPRSTNRQVEIWELSIDCNRGASVMSGSENLCGRTVSKYAYALAAPEEGFTVLTADLRNSLSKRVAVNLELRALDAEGNLMAREPKKVRISAGPAAEN